MADGFEAGSKWCRSMDVAVFVVVVTLVDEEEFSPLSAALL
jgi:hypothetical protein